MTGTMNQSTEAVKERQLRRYYELVDAGDIPGLVDLFADDAVYHRPGYPPLVGREQLERFYRQSRKIKEGRHSITTLLTSEEQAAAHGVFEGTLRDGSHVTVRFADFFQFNQDAAFQRRDTFFFSPQI